MTSVRRLIFSLASAVGVWLLVSFAGAMVDSANAAFWSDSLMWALLSALIVAPILLMVHNAFSGSQERPSQERPSSRSASARSDEAQTEDRTPFVEEEPGEMRTLWPEPETEPKQEDEWPPQEVYDSQDHIRA
jgi:hypothetical protein